MNVIPVSRLQLNLVTQTLFSAFANDPVLIWLFGDEATYQRDAYGSMYSWVKWAHLYGAIYATDQFESVTLWKKPERHEFTFWQLLRSGMMSAPCVRDKAIRARIFILEDVIKNQYQQLSLNQAFWYCWMFGTKPASQGFGFGKGLMRDVIRQFAATKFPCCLETGKAENVFVYEKLGYRKISEVALPNSNVTLHFMRHDGG